jgi:DNA repair protein RAD50
MLLLFLLPATHPALLCSNLSAPALHPLPVPAPLRFLQVKTVEMACGDLERYHKALEKALLAFHTNKMTDINKVGKKGMQGFDCA